MRDPKRIPIVLEAIRKHWEKVPDWRLGQLIVNASSCDPFYMEDDILIKNLEKLFKKDEE